MEQASDLVKNVIEIRESLKIFDQRLSQLKDTIRMVDHNNIDRYNEIKTSLQGLSSALSADKTKLVELDDAINRIEQMTDRFAKLQDIKVLDKYMQFLDPSRFLSKEDVIKIVDEYMSGKKWG